MSMTEEEPGGTYDESAGLDTSTAPGAPPEDRPWYAQDNGMLPINLAKQAGRGINNFLRGQLTSKDVEPMVPGEQSPYAGPPEGNPIQSGVQAVEQGVRDSFQKPIPNGTREESDLPSVGDAMSGGVKRIASYLSGEGAASPQEAKSLTEQLKAQGMTDDDANLLAVHEAAAAGGPAAAWAMIQYNRMAFNAKQSFARVALNGIDGKAGDIQSAAKAATEAGSHVLDGSSVSFHADKWGVTATVSLPGTSQRQTFDMTPDQFNQYLDLSKTSQWDRLMEEGGIPVALAKVGAKPMRGGQDASAAPDQQSQAAPTGDGSEPGYNPGERPKETPGVKDVTDADQPAIPGTHDANGHYLGPKTKPATNYGDELEARSSAKFGTGNVNTEGARQQWMADQEEKDLNRANKVDVASESGNAKRDVAKTAAGARVASSQNAKEGRVESAGITAEQRAKSSAARLQYLRDDMARKAQAMAQNHQDARMRENGRNFGRELLAHPGASEAEIAALGKKYGVDALPQGETPTSVAPQQPQQAAQQGKKFYNGRWYTKDEYMRDVLGQRQ